MELGEVELKAPQSDGVLFQRIRERYEHVCHSTLPMGWRWRFRKPDTAIFVKVRFLRYTQFRSDISSHAQFRLGKRPFVSPISGSIEKPAIPPDNEVVAGNYKYFPVPMDEPCIDNLTFFHHFYSPASKHTDEMWGPRLPWKLGPGLASMEYGWGIHIEDRPDWPLFAGLNFVLLLTSGLVAGIYSWRMKDPPTGVTIGAWLTAVQTLALTSLFFWWS